MKQNATKFNTRLIRSLRHQFVFVWRSTQDMKAHKCHVISAASGSSQISQCRSTYSKCTSGAGTPSISTIKDSYLFTISWSTNCDILTSISCSTVSVHSFIAVRPVHMTVYITETVYQLQYPCEKAVSDNVAKSKIWEYWYTVSYQHSPIFNIPKLHLCELYLWTMIKTANQYNKYMQNV